MRELKLDKLAQRSSITFGLAVLFGNLGAGVIYDDLPEEKKKWMNRPWVRKLIIFALIFNSTRSLLTSVIIMGLYLLWICW